MIDALGSCKTDKEEAAPLPLYQRIYNKVASWIRPGLFLFSAVLVICSASIFLNVRLAERMQQLQDNDMKHRYLLMQGQADGEIFDMLENKFKWQRDNGFIRSLTDIQVIHMNSSLFGCIGQWSQLPDRGSGHFDSSL